MTTNYDKMAERVKRGELKVKPGTVRRGPDAAADAQRLLMEATGARNTAQLTHIALGRPTLGAKGSASPMVRARVPQALKDRVAEVAELEHRKESDVVRDALAAYVKVRAAG